MNPLLVQSLLLNAASIGFATATGAALQEHYNVVAAVVAACAGICIGLSFGIAIYARWS